MSVLGGRLSLLRGKSGEEASSSGAGVEDHGVSYVVSEEYSAYAVN